MPTNEKDVSKETSTVEDTVSKEQVLEHDEELVNKTTKDDSISNYSFDENQKKKNIVPFIILAVIAFILIVGGIGYFTISKNPTNVLKGAINNAYKDFSKELKKYDKKQIDFNILEDSFKVSGDVELSGSLFKELNGEKLSYDMGLDYAKKKASIEAKINEDGKDLVDASVYFKDNKSYIKSNSLFNNIYDLGEAEFDEIFDFSEFEDIINSTSNYKAPSVEDIDYVVKEFKDALIKSLDKDQMTKSKETLEINDINVKTTKITYNIDKSSAKDLFGKMADIILENDELIKKLADMTNQDKSDVKDLFKELKDKDAYEDFGKGGDFSVYTTGLTNKVVGFELNINGVKIIVRDYKDNAYIEVSEKESDIKFIITSVKEKDVYNIDIKLNKEKIATLKVKEVNKDTIDLEYDIQYEDIKIKGSLKMTIKEVSNNEYKLDVDFNINYDIEGEKNDFGVKFSANVKLKEEVANIDTSKATLFDDMSEDEANKILNKVKELQNSKLYKYIDKYADLDDILGDLESVPEPNMENSESSNHIINPDENNDDVCIEGLC